MSTPENIQAFRSAVKAARRRGDIGILLAARINFRAEKYFTDYQLIAHEEMETPDAMQGLIDWENLDVEKFKAILEAITKFIEVLVGLF